MTHSDLADRIRMRLQNIGNVSRDENFPTLIRAIDFAVDATMADVDYYTSQPARITPKVEA